MWGYQSFFRTLMERRAQEVLQVIAPAVQPRAILVGIRTPEKAEGPPVCVDPEDGDWDPTIFFGCDVRAEHIYTTHPDHSIIYADAPRMHDKPEIIRRKSAREAVQEVTAAYDAQHDTSTFCGGPTRISGYHIVPILQFNKSQIQDLPQLAAPIRYFEWTSSTGLFESTVSCLLDESTNALEGKDPGRYLNDTFPMDTTAILRDAGGRFCTAIALTSGDMALMDVFSALNIISALPYEGAGAVGELIFAHADSEAVDLRVRFNKPVRINEHKLARKIIEMSGQGLLCVNHGAKGIIGLGMLHASEADDVIRVSFSGHYKWDLYYKNRLLMRTAFGVPSLPSVRLKEEAFRSNARRILPHIDGVAERRLWSIVEAAMEQRHGTIIVISEAAEEEARRLKKQSLGIAPIELTRDLAHRLSGIDGALLIDPKGICYAIGVILDGMATNDGDLSRGARYNSASRYISSAKSPTMCLVVSEDGYVNLLPKLRPQIRKSEIDYRIALLKSQDANNYHKTMSWLEEHRFYVTSEQCKVINKELARISVSRRTDGEIRLGTSTFIADPAMNDTYYCPESEPGTGTAG
jgi:hypothetical protein